MTEQELSEAKKQVKGKPILEKLLSDYQMLMSSPYAKTYITVYNQVEDFNDQLTIKDGETKQRVIGQDKHGDDILSDYTPGKLDIFGSKDDKEFDRAWKYMNDSMSLLETLDKLRAKLSPEEKKQVAKILSADSAENYLNAVK